MRRKAGGEMNTGAVSDTVKAHWDSHSTCYLRRMCGSFLMTSAMVRKFSTAERNVKTTITLYENRNSNEAMLSILRLLNS